MGETSFHALDGCKRFIQGESANSRMERNCRSTTVNDGNYSTSATTAATPSASIPNTGCAKTNDQKLQKPSIRSECQSCIELLQHVLFNNGTSNSSRLLRSMTTQQQESNTTTKTTKQLPATVRLILNGVQVHIPTTSATDNNNLQQHGEEHQLAESETTIISAGTEDSKSIPSPSANLLRRITASLNRSQDIAELVSESSTILATTSTTGITSVPATTTVDNNDNDWIDVTCRTCSDFGTEANARAFVMGPNPLSIVVCQNRLVSSLEQRKPQQQTSNSRTDLNATPIQSQRLPNFTAPTWNALQSKLSNNSTASAVIRNNSSNYTPKMIQEMDEIVTHELIHIYDVRQLHMDLVHCNDLAYSEVRAAREAECSSYTKQQQNYHDHPTLFHDNNKLQQQRQLFEECVKTRATTATKNLFPFRAKRCIRNVFEKAMNDHRPQKSL